MRTVDRPGRPYEEYENSPAKGRRQGWSCRGSQQQQDRRATDSMVRSSRPVPDGVGSAAWAADRVSRIAVLI